MPLSAVTRPLEACLEHDVLQVQLESGSTEFMEVIQGWSSTEQSCKLLWKGQLMQLAADTAAATQEQSGSLQLEALGAFKSLVTVGEGWGGVYAVCHMKSLPSAACRG